MSPSLKNWGQCNYFSFSHTNNEYEVHIVHNSIAMFSLKILTPLWDSNPSLLFLRRLRCPLGLDARAKVSDLAFEDFPLRLRSDASWGSRVARLFLIQYTNTGKIYQNATKLPKCHKIYQKAAIYTKWPWNILTFSNLKALQNLPKLIF
jgi:hypothetical protein